MSLEQSTNNERIMFLEQSNGLCCNLAVMFGRSVALYCSLFQRCSLAFAQIFVTIEILLTCGKHLHNRIISLIGEVLAHSTTLTPPPFIEMSGPSQ